MKRIVILTGSELRHEFFRKYMAQSAEIEVINSYCEGLEKSLRTRTEQDEQANLVRLQHVAAREQAEQDFFGVFAAAVGTTAVPDHSNPVFLPKGEINAPEYTQAIITSAPDLVVSYGCSIIKEPLIRAFQGRFVNVHLGLSPYYRGSGTNYWPLVNGEPEYVGATFMYIDPGIDTGEIIHHIRARFAWGDTPSQIGNRLIMDMAETYRRLVVHFDQLASMPQLPVPPDSKLYWRKDYTEESVVTLYRNFADGLIERYLETEASRCARVPLITNPILKEN